MNSSDSFEARRRMRGSSLLALALFAAHAVPALAQSGSLAPATMPFGNQTVTTSSATQSITIANTHASTAFQVTGHTSNNPTRFPIVPGGSCGALPYMLAAQQSCTVHVAFTPDLTGNHFSTFSITGTSPTTTFTPTTVSISGFGTAVPATLAPGTMPFGDQTITTSSAPQSITIANTHGSASVQVMGHTSNNPTRFPIVPGGSCGAPPFTLDAGQSCTVRIAFTPDVTGNHFSTFSITGTNPATTFTPSTVSISGFGTAVPATLAPATLPFGNQTVTTSSATQSITIANTHGSVTLQVMGHTSNNPTRFPIVPGGSCGVPPFMLAAGQSCTVRIAFTPDLTGNHFSTFSITGSNPAATFTPATVSLSGFGTEVPATLAPATLPFGNQTVTTSSATQSITIANTHGSVTLQVMGHTSNNPTRFPIVPGGSCGAPPFMLAAGQSCTVRIAFNPDLTGNHFSTFSITGANPATTFTPGTVSISGFGTAVPLVLAPATLAFGEEHIFATTEPQTIAIGNAATVAFVNINAISLNSPRFIFAGGGTCAPVPFALPPGGSCTIAVAFRPDVVGNHFGSFSIATTSPQSSVAPGTVSLSGFGTPDSLFTDSFETP